MRAPPSNRARKFLLSHLTPAQQETYKRRGYFFVRAKGSTKAPWKRTRDRFFVLRDGMNIVEVDLRGNGVETYGFFIRETYSYPLEDQLLAQKLWVETNLGVVLDKACVMGSGSVFSEVELRNFLAETAS